VFAESRDPDTLLFPRALFDLPDSSELDAEQDPDLLTLSDGRVVFDLRAATASIDGADSGMKQKEYDLFLYLASRAGKVIDREQLLVDIWGDGYYSDTLVNVMIRRCRAKLEVFGLGDLIETRRGKGYLVKKDSPKPESEPPAPEDSSQWPILINQLGRITTRQANLAFRQGEDGLTRVSAEAIKALAADLQDGDVVLFGDRPMLEDASKSAEDLHIISSFAEDRLVIDTAKRQVSLDGVAGAFSDREFKILKILTENKGAIVTRVELNKLVWGYSEERGRQASTLNNAITSLRRHLQDLRWVVQTKGSLGYIFDDTPQGESAE
jgi:DNA-binding response OmpR family regulator